MSRLDNLRRLTADGQFSDEQRQVIEKVAEVFNFHMEQVVNVVNGNLDFDNLKSKLVQFDVTVDSSGVPISTTNFTQAVGAIGGQVISAINTTSSVLFPTSAPFVTFSATGRGVYTIKHVSGLQANNTYRIILKLEYT